MVFCTFANEKQGNFYIFLWIVSKSDQAKIYQYGPNFPKNFSDVNENVKFLLQMTDWNENKQNASQCTIISVSSDLDSV